MFESKNRRLYTKEFKQDAVNLSKQPGYTVPSAAKSLGIASRQIYRWRKEESAGGPIGYAGSWWSSTGYGSNDAYFRHMGYDSDDVVREHFDKSNLYSVRCMQD